MNNCAIKIINLEKSYKNRKPIFIDANLEIKAADFLFITGISGSGKTTIFKLILGVEDIQKGQVLFFGRNVHQIKPSYIPYHRREIGLVFQDYKLLEKRTVYENIAVPLLIKGVKKSEINQKVRNICNEINILHLLEQKVSTLSGGEQQLTAIARAAIHSPKMILADEPTANLDNNAAKRIIDTLQKLNQKGITIVIATHNIELIKLYPHQTVFIKNKHFLTVETNNHDFKIEQ